MRVIKVDEYLVINIYTGSRKWLTQPPRKKSAYDVVIRIKGTVKMPDSIPLIDIGEVTIPELEALQEARMG